MAGRRRAPEPRPLWTCPRCGHRFITAHMWHSCARYRLARHFTGKPPVIRRMFQRVRGLLRRCGPVTVYAQKTRIVFQVRVRFGGVQARNRWLDVGLWLERQAEHPRLVRVEPFAAYDSHGYGHWFRFTAPEQIDRAFARLAREAYATGCQAGQR